jgi:hypothetical protein
MSKRSVAFMMLEAGATVPRLGEQAYICNKSCQLARGTPMMREAVPEKVPAEDNEDPQEEFDKAHS